MTMHVLNPDEIEISNSSYGHWKVNKTDHEQSQIAVDVDPKSQ